MKTIDETKGLLEMKAGALARVFSQLDPNTPVYNNGEGRFIINASNNDIEKLAASYDNEFEEEMKSYNTEPCKCGEHCECGCGDNLPVYGHPTQADIVDVNDFYNSGDIDADMASMDEDFAQYQLSRTIALNEEILNAIDKYEKEMLNNLVSYQNSKNYRAKKEMVRLVSVERR